MLERILDKLLKDGWQIASCALVLTAALMGLAFGAYMATLIVVSWRIR